jgi:hypothetical protein
MTENIKEALQYAVDLAGQEDKVIKDKGGKEWYDSNSHRLLELEPKQYYPELLRLNTLDSLINYYKNNINEIADMRTIVVVDNPREVYVYTEDDDREKRTTLINVEASIPHIEFDTFMPADTFNIELQSKFLDNYDRENVLDFASAIVIDEGIDVEDDGVAQITTVKQGVASRSKAKAPNPVTLAPYRTFLEVEQPPSDFILRLNKEANFALFEADGGFWKLQAVRLVKEYLAENLEDFENVFVLA